MRIFSSFLITFLIPLLAVMPLRAELTDALPGQAATGQPGVLKIRLDEGSRSAVEANSASPGFSVVVTDAAGKPVSDAAVAIRLPEEGASGVFASGEHASVVYTDASGVAKFPQVHWGATTGSLSIRVTAVKGELHAGALIEQDVVAASGRTPAAAPVAPFPNTDATPGKAVTAPPAAPAPVIPTAQVVPAQPEAKAKTPGVPTSVAAVHSGATPEQSLPAAQPAATGADSVSVVNTSGSKGGGGISKKWVIIGVVLAGIGAGAALALAGGKSSPSATTAAATTTIGSPSVNIGH